MPANPLEYNKKGPHSFEWGLLVAEGGFEPPKALLRCPSHCSLMRRTRRPLCQILLPTSATGGGRRICPGLTLRSKVQTPFYSKNNPPTKWSRDYFWLRREDLNLRPPGYRFAPLAVPEKIFALFARSIFSTAAQTPSSLYPPPAALEGVSQRATLIGLITQSCRCKLSLQT